MQHQPETHVLQYVCVNSSSECCKPFGVLALIRIADNTDCCEQLGIRKILRYGHEACYFRVASVELVGTWVA